MGVSFGHELTNIQKKSLAITLGLVFIAKQLPLVSYVLNAYNTAVHELGHACTAWLFGYFAIPTFDLINGGGVTYLVSRPFLMSLFAFVFILANLFLIKKNKSISNKILGFALLIYCLLYFSRVHGLLITFMGLGGEILISFMLAWQALSNLRITMNTVYLFFLFLSMAIFQNTTNFLYSLLFNPQSKFEYIDEKKEFMSNNTLTNDLVKLNESTGLSLDFYSWILLFLTVIAIYYILRINKLPALPQHLFKHYVKSLWHVSKEQKNQFIKKFKHR